VATASENRLNMRHEEGAERTLRYFRHCADGGQDDNHEFTAASEFLRLNGQHIAVCTGRTTARHGECGLDAPEARGGARPAVSISCRMAR